MSKNEVQSLRQLRGGSAGKKEDFALSSIYLRTADIPANNGLPVRISIADGMKHDHPVRTRNREPLLKPMHVMARHSSACVLTGVMWTR